MTSQWRPTSTARLIANAYHAYHAPLLNAVLLDLLIRPLNLDL